MSTDVPAYEVYALKYGSTTVRKSGKYHRFADYRDPDAEVALDFYFWLLRSPARTVLVDCGYDDVRTAARGYLQDAHPLALLESVGVAATDVDHVVLSHLHFDHIGNVDLFPRATFSVARAELDYWTGPFADRRMICESGDRVEIERVVDLQRAGRVRLVEGTTELFPGVEVTPMRGHTPGQLLTRVTTRDGVVVLASDAIHFYEEMRLDRPYWIFHDLEGMYHGYELLRRWEREPGTTIVAGHDPAVMSMFAPVNGACVDLTQALL
ncbi:N-acyl homoserine lactonase family protein [Microbacterium sp. X-17]|uniref:N-acyl homoserine lactonase family protein n=1 Tax=Microbacterium sp. X-17 TaxID=3144404 RepID=UPI0031F5D773